MSMGMIHTLKKAREHIIQVTENEMDGYDIEKLNAKLRRCIKDVEDCDALIADCMDDLHRAMMMEPKESKALKSRMFDASANREIFELKVKVVTAKIRKLKHDEALKLCGNNPTIPSGMDILTFNALLDHIYNHTETAAIGDSTTIDGKKAKHQINMIIKNNPKLKEYANRVKK